MRAPSRARDVLDEIAGKILEGRTDADLTYARWAGSIGFRPVDPDRCVLRFPLSDEFYGKPVPAQQVLWADREGRFPANAAATRMWSTARIRGATRPPTWRRSSSVWLRPGATGFPARCSSSSLPPPRKTPSGC